MYTFQALATVAVDHKGFEIIVAFSIALLILCLFNEPETFFVWFFIACIPCGIAYGVSYHWTNQEAKTFANVPVVAEFAGFEPEGYKEKSGKSMVDRHYMYVVYTVNGDPVILQSQTGQVYPKTVTLYKN